jgi:hypothetical protein
MQLLNQAGVSYTEYYFIEVKMPLKLLHKLCFLFFVSLFFSNTLFAQAKKGPPKPYTPEELQKMDKGKLHPPKGPSFQIATIENVKGQCLALLADDQGRTLEEFIQLDKLPILEAIVSEAIKFGLTEESVGGTKPLTTRFSDKQAPNFVVDVSKVAKQTRFYVTINGLRGRLTIDAGTIKRGDPDATALLNEIHTKIQAVQAQNPIQ